MPQVPTGVDATLAPSTATRKSKGSSQKSKMPVFSGFEQLKMISLFPPTCTSLIMKSKVKKLIA
jgi:hypothetical protein